MKIALCLKGYDSADFLRVTRVTRNGPALPIDDYSFIDEFVSHYPEIDHVCVEKVYVRDTWEEGD